MFKQITQFRQIFSLSHDVTHSRYLYGIQITVSHPFDQPGCSNFFYCFITCFSSLSTCRFIFPHRFTLQYQRVGVMRESVQDRICRCRVLNQPGPLIYREPFYLQTQEMSKINTLTHFSLFHLYLSVLQLYHYRSFDI